MSKTSAYHLKKYSHLSKIWTYGSIFCGAGATAAIILQAWALATIINGVGFDGRPLDWVTPYLFTFMGGLVVRLVLTYFSQRFAFFAGETVKAALQRDLYQDLFSRSPFFVTEHGSGALSTLLIDAPETIRQYDQQFVPLSRLAILSPLMILIVVCFYDGVSGVIMGGTAPLIPLFMVLIGGAANKKNDELWATLTRMGNSFLDTIQGLPTLKIFGSTLEQEKVLDDASNAYRINTLAVLKVAFLSSVTLEFFATVSIAMVAVLIGFRLLWHEISYLDGLFILLLAPEFYSPLRKMGAAYHAKMEAEAAAKKIAEIFKECVPTQERTDLTLLSPEAIRTIEFDDVSYTYPGKEAAALTHVSFRVAEEAPLTIKGPSGAGKSTIFLLLTGMVQPSSGRVLVNGQDLRQIKMKDWRALLSWVPQNPTLFHGTILENLKLGVDDTVNLETIRKTCAQVALDDYIMALPDGYETRIGENGAGLSGGQIQRLALVRALLRDTPIFLFDEPTASLDHETEKIVHAVIQDIIDAQKIVIMITHRSTPFDDRQRVMTLQNGRAS